MSSTGSTNTSNNDIGREWDGDPSTWPRHKLRIKKFKQTHAKIFDDYQWFFTATDPKSRGRIEEDYVVQEPDSDEDEEQDESGAEPGTRIKKQTQAQFKKSCRMYKKANGSWFTILAASIIGGQAEETVMRMQSTGNEDGKLLEKTITEHCETKSNQHASHLFKQWVSEHKSDKTSIHEHNKQWNRTLDVINSNLDWPTMQCYLYLMSLGPVWSTFYDHMTTTTGRTAGHIDLTSLQSAAVDWIRTHQHDTSDESRPQQIAYSAKEQQKHRGTKRKRREHELTNEEKQQRPCIQCGHPIHNWYGCFSGYLDWMNAEQRRDWIEADRMKRGYYTNNNRQNHVSHHRNQNHNSHQNNNNHQNNQPQQQQHTDTAALAELQNKHKLQMHVLEETLRSKHLHGIANELNDAGFSLKMD